jgi:hypothetical protein
VGFGLSATMLTPSSSASCPTAFLNRLGDAPPLKAMLIPLVLPDLERLFLD